jgi:hypothetical protein|nr:MAG TPA: hypothetical protein [Caudoviricetes sp.]
MGKAKIENLKPFGTRTEEEEREMRRRGGIRSGQTRARNKLLKDILAMLLAKKTPDQDITNEEAICLALIQRAIEQGDPKAFETIRDTLGQKPTENVRSEIEGGVVFEWGSSK